MLARDGARDAEAEADTGVVRIARRPQLASNWVLSGGARWDLEANKINQNTIGAGYVDDCFVIAANYVTSYSYAAGATLPQLSHGFTLQLGLRTLGTYAIPVPTTR